MISDHYKGGMTERLLVKVITCDPATSRIEVVGKDAAVIQVGVGVVPPFFRWPVQGEFWTIVRENAEWSMESRVPTPDDKQLNTLAPGEAMVQAEKIWTPSGDHLVLNDDFSSQITDLQDQIDDIEVIAGGGGVALDPWHLVGQPGEPAYAASHSGTLRFHKDIQGRVWITGSVSGPTTAATAFTLPVGYRPTFDHYYDNLQSGGTAGTYINVTPAGAVTITSPSGASYVNLSFDSGTVTSVLNTTAVAMDTWHLVGAPGEPAFQNGWGNVGGETTVAFKKDPFGNVVLRGTVGGGTQGTTVFTLPVGYRPGFGRDRNTSINNQGTSAWGQVNVQTDGTVLAWADTNQYISLDQVEFDTGTTSSYVVGAIPDPPEAMHWIGNAGEPVFQNSWVNYDSGLNYASFASSVYRNAGFYKDRGRVYLQGVIRSGTVPGNAFVLPPDYRPYNQRAFIVLTNTTPGYVTVESNGAVNMASVSNAYVFLDQINFDLR